MPFASPGCCEGSGVRRDAGSLFPSVFPLTQLQGSSGPKGARRSRSGAGAIPPPVVRGGAAAAMAAPLWGGRRHKAEAFPMPRGYPVIPSARNTMIPMSPASAGRRGEFGGGGHVGGREDEGRSRGPLWCVRGGPALPRELTRHGVVFGLQCFV